MLPALLVSLSLAFSPWPGSVPTPVDEPVPVSAPVSAAALANPFESSFAPGVEAPAPAPSFRRASVPQHSAGATPQTTLSVTRAPDPPYETVAYARPYPEPRAYSARERRMLWAGLALSLASIAPAAFTIRAAVDLTRARNRFEATEPSELERRTELQREVLRQANIVVVAGIATMVLATTALVLFGVARRKRKVEPPPTPPPLWTPSV